MFSDYIIAQARDEAETTRRLADSNPDKFDFVAGAFIDEQFVEALEKTFTTPTDNPAEVREKLELKKAGFLCVACSYFEEGNTRECYKAVGITKTAHRFGALAHDVRAYYLDYLEKQTNETRR